MTNKQALELLEILKKKLVHLWLINDLINFFIPGESIEKRQYVLNCYNEYNDKQNKLNFKEFEKIIRWLENENTKDGTIPKE